jgi:hypothetical protein
MYKKQMLFRPSGTIQEIPNSGNPRTLLCNFGKFGFVPEKNVFTEYALRGTLQNFGENRDIFGHFFSEMSQILKKVNKKTKISVSSAVFFYKPGLWMHETLKNK